MLNWFLDSRESDEIMYQIMKIEKKKNPNLLMPVYIFFKHHFSINLKGLFYTQSSWGIQIKMFWIMLC